MTPSETKRLTPEDLAELEKLEKDFRLDDGASVLDFTLKFRTHAPALIQAARERDRLEDVVARCDKEIDELNSTVVDLTTERDTLKEALNEVFQAYVNVPGPGEAVPGFDWDAWGDRASAALQDNPGASDE